jgi:putative membrane-bound dehydrogenase-like protein
MRAFWLVWATALAGTASILLTAELVANSKGVEPGKPAGPLTPQEELATFRVPKGFRVELVASEPNIVDPVAMAFDEDGRLFVVEMRGYPNEGVATGVSTSGRIKMLEDRDGDGYFEHCTTFADNLRFPTSVMPWRGGILVADAPNLYFMEDTAGAGAADKRTLLYTGFTLSNIQQLINSLQWGLDNWVYGCAGSNGGTIQSAEDRPAPPVTLRSRGVRFHPEQPGSLEPTSGGGQFGLAADDWQQWFTATNSQHLRHIVLPDHYLRRNPSLPVSAVTIDIPDHGAACKVNRISPFEAWRVERTTRRAQGPDAQRFPSTELVPGGFVTSACSPVVYSADLFPPVYRGNTFVCDPANNLVHRDVLSPKGATFVASRGDVDCEFFASTDTWCRPVNLTVGPDGALYVVDFYREVIETPLSLPDDIKKKLNLESRGRGRIWRIVPEGAALVKRPPLRKAATADLVKQLEDANLGWRLTAQRLLVERRDQTAVKALAQLAQLAREGIRAQARAHALWTLAGMKALEDGFIVQALGDADWHVREQALRIAEPRLGSSARLRQAVAALAEDPAARVRFQLAFTLGAANAPELVAALAKVARRDVADLWTQVAVLSSAAQTAPALLETLVGDPAFIVRPTAAHLQMLTRLASLVGAQSGESDLARALHLLGGSKEPAAPWPRAILEGLGQGLQNSRRPLAGLWEQPPPALKDGLNHARHFFTEASAIARDGQRPSADRTSAIRLLGYGPFSIAAETLSELLGPRNPTAIQLAAIRSLSLFDNPRVADILLLSWNSYSPGARREVLEALFARPERLARLLDAVERKQVLAGQIEPFHLDRLRKHTNLKLRSRAQTLLAGEATPDRRKIVEDYQSALELKGDAARGKAVFKKTCATCHRLENEGVEVGPDLLSALRNKSRDVLLIDILDPSREVDPRYINYLVTNKAGQVFTGMIAAETASSITLRRAEKAEDTLLRSQIDDVQATAKSVMPDGLEMQLSKQDVADLIAYLQTVATPK